MAAGFLFIAVSILLAQGSSAFGIFHPEHSFCVIPKEQVTSESCREYQNEACFALEKLEESWNNDSTVLACNNYYSLERVMQLRNLHNIVLLGQPNGTTFGCTKHTAGLQVTESSNVTIENISFHSCGALPNSTFLPSMDENQHRTVKISVFVSRVAEITFSRVNIESGNGIGMVLLNSYGSLQSCTVKDNGGKQVGVESGGLIIQYDERFSEDVPKGIAIDNCVFFSNKAENTSHTYAPCDMDLFTGSGGGVALYLRQKTIAEVTIVITNSSIGNNSAIWGGGMYLMFCGGLSTVKLENVSFTGNMCERGGGGLDIGFETMKEPNESQTFYCTGCFFTKNRAYFGGGVALYASRHQQINLAFFENCTWDKNSAHYGAALSLAPELIETPREINVLDIRFKDVFFESNFILTHSMGNYYHCNECSSYHDSFGNGILLVTIMTLQFEGSVKFQSNRDSGIYAVSSILVFVPQTKARFVNNTATNGGAFFLVGFSAIKVYHNVTIDMIDNTALERGGAIYHRSIDKNDYTYSHNCFIQIDPAPDKYNNNNNNRHSEVVFNFSGNKATLMTAEAVIHTGNDIYTSSLLPCSRYCNLFSEDITETIFDCIGEFNFDEGIRESVATSAGCLIPNSTEALKVIPGKRITLPFRTQDDYDNIVYDFYFVQVEDNDAIVIDGSSAVTSVKDVIIKGKPGERGNITVRSVSIREALVTFEVILQHCPPFFIYIEMDKRCKCFQIKDGDAEQQLVYLCNSGKFLSHLRHGYWAGNLSPRTAGTIFYGYCPRAYCYYGNDKINNYHELPTAIEDLDRKMCGERRTGVLCGQCGENFSVHFHSRNLNCDSEGTCSYGWILFILSEMIPLTALFLFLLVFNISLTSGSVNGFILYAQVYSSLQALGDNFIYHPKLMHQLMEVLSIAYSAFNINFFEIKSLSFCLWRGAEAIHILAFKFVAVAFALLLVLLTVFVINRFAIVNRCLFLSKGNSMIHGLTTFLVMVYTQCTVVSIDLLHFTPVKSPDGTSMNVVYYQGSIEAFSAKHTPFAALAIFSLITITAIPPLFLLYYPLCYKLSSALHLDDKRAYKVLSRLFPISKLKPFFDSFQGSFKDDRRYFAGLYFIYRVTLLASTLVPKLVQAYIIIQFQLILMFLIHVLAWPYAKKVHNIIDAVIFSNLALVNALSLYGHIKGKYVQNINIKFISYLKFILVLSPLLGLSLYAMKVLLQIIKDKIKKMSASNENNDSGSIIST